MHLSRFTNAATSVLVTSMLFSIRRVSASQMKIFGDIAVRNYSRIRIKNINDIPKAYPLLLEYLETPNRAFSVQEFVLDRPHPGGSGCYLVPPPSDDEAPKQHEISNDVEYLNEESQIVSSLNRLGLDVLSKTHTDAVKAVKKWRNAHIAQIGSMEGPSEWQQYYSGDSATEADFAQLLGPLLISLTPNLEKLKFTNIEPVVEDFLIKVNYGLLPQDCLQKLRHVTFGPGQNAAFWMYDERFYNRYDVISMTRLIHRLPSIESISVEAITEDNNGKNFQPPGISNLKRIHIGHSDISSSTLSALIRVCKALEEFSFSIGGRCSLDGGFHIMSPKVLGKALLIQKHSLKVLDVDVDASIWGGRGYWEGEEYIMNEEDETDESEIEYIEQTLEYEREDKYFQMDEAESQGLGLPLLVKDLPDTRSYGLTIGSMHDFTALTRLSIGVRLLLGPQVYKPSTGNATSLPAPFRLADSLPPNLEYLCIRGYRPGMDSTWDEQIKDFMDNKTEMRPALKEVLGIEKEIRSQESVDDPDHNTDLLWRDPQGEEDRWEEWGFLSDYFADVDESLL
jgi:hypothetical protein